MNERASVSVNYLSIMIKREAQRCKMKLKMQEARVDLKYMLRFKNTRKLVDIFFSNYFAAGCMLFAKLRTKDLSMIVHDSLSLL